MKLVPLEFHLVAHLGNRDANALGNHSPMVTAQDHSPALPISQRPYVYPKLLGGFLDRPAHDLALREKAFGNVLRSWKMIVTQEPYNCLYGRNRRLRVAFLPI